MRTDLDRLMKENNIDALLVNGAAQHNPYMAYLTGIAHITRADLIKKRGEPAILFHNPMERDEALRSGLKTQSYAKYPWEEMLKEAGGDSLVATTLRYQRMFRDLEISSGRIALYGRAELSKSYGVFSRLQRAMPDLDFVTSDEDDVLSLAMATKDEEEIQRMRRMGRITMAVVDEIADFLTSHKVEDNTLIKTDGEALKIADVKRRINRLLIEHDEENPEDTIFAIGRDAGVPHSSGNPEDTVRLGETIVFDIFPCEYGGGFYHDFTRTWCLGFAPEKAEVLYEQVRTVFDKLVANLKLNQPFSRYQRMACEHFEQMGHPTLLNDPTTESGYVHSIGHGVGLHIHERPFSHPGDSSANNLKAGTVITIEPGLYYPEQNVGVRLENTVVALADGRFESLADYPMHLVLPMKKA